jgi:hypothetical protein
MRTVGCCEKSTKLAIGVARQAGVILRDTPQDYNDDLLVEVLGQVHLALALLAVERVGRGEQNHGLARRIGFAYPVAPTLTCADAVQVDKHVLRRPAVGEKPVAERQRVDIVLAGMGDKQTRQGGPQGLSSPQSYRRQRTRWDAATRPIGAPFRPPSQACWSQGSTLDSHNRRLWNMRQRDV